MDNWLATAELDSCQFFFCLQIDRNNKQKLCWFLYKMGKLLPKIRHLFVTKIDHLPQKTKTKRPKKAILP
jgi:hypothetical protein